MAASPAQRWQEQRTFHHSRYDAAWLTARRRATISVCLPARECATSVGAIVESLVELRAAGAIDDVVVVDADSADGTGRIAAEAGARVFSQSALEPEFGPVLGKGDALWRALSVLESDLVCFLDADTIDFSPHFAVGLLGPLVEFAEVSFVKAFYRRPFVAAGVTVEDAGGRVNHLLARPALAMFYGELAGVRQPLAGEIAARRSLLERLPFTTGYGIEMAMLLDVLEQVGLDGMAQVDLDVHINAHQSLRELSAMAYTVLQVIATRLARSGRLSEFAPAPLLRDGEPFEARLEERPPSGSRGKVAPFRVEPFLEGH
jgi:glucosyl-3-phosphoglycerate synthase